MSFFKKTIPSSVIGIAFEGSQVEAALLRRSGSIVQVLNSFKFTISSNPLTADPIEVGREIREQLDSLNVGERRCVVGMPLSWVLTMQARLPELPEADVAGFLEIEAERHFPYGPESMFIANSRCRFAEGEEYATLVGVPREQVLQVQQALKAAKLKPASFTLGIAALENPEETKDDALIVLNVGVKTIELMMTCGNGVAALRALEGGLNTEGDQRQIQTDTIARELRITLGQTSASLRSRIKKVKILGDAAVTEKLAREISPRLEAMGLEVEVGKDCSKILDGRIRPAGQAISSAISVGARYLLESHAPFEFLPPTTSSWKQISTKVSSKKLIWIGATAGSAAVLIIGLFLFQGWQLSTRRSKWAVMEPHVRDLEAMQQNIRQYRPWFDNSFRTLSILKKLTEAFPAEGIVSAKTVGIHDSNLVSCSGLARDNQALFKMRDLLSKSKEVTDVKWAQIQGKSPIQFNFNFRWVEGGAHEGN